MGLKKIPLSVMDRILYPTVPIVVLAEYNGRLGGMLAAWWCQVSFDPPRIGVAIAPERYTYKLIKNSGVFGVGFLDYSMVDKTPYLGDVSERFFRDKIKKSGLNVVKGEVLGVPLLAEFVAAMEIELEKIVEVGDHDFFVGNIKSAYADEDDFDQLWKLRKYRPLMYLGRTRRPGPVYRIYVTAKGFEKRKIEFAPGELKGAAKQRIRVLGEVRRAFKVASSKEDALNKIKKILRRYGLEGDDAEYYLDEVSRS